MKKLLGWLLIILLIPVSYILIINKKSIDIKDYKHLNQFKEQRKIRNSGVSFSIIKTGTATTSEAFVVKGGSLFKAFSIIHSAIFIKHPKGNILFDTGLGSSIDEQFETEMPSKYKLLMKYEKTESVLTQLEKHGYSEDSISAIIPSHLHWDHASGLVDFINTKILISETEKEWAFSDAEEFDGRLKSQYDNESLRWKFLNFKSDQFENFDQSLDLYQDGSIILLPIPGHTPGSVALLLTTDTGERYFFTGDLTWSLKGLNLPAEKFSISSNIVDNDPSQLRNSLARIFFFKKRYPETYLIPAHDFTVQKKFGFFPKFLN